MDCIDMNAVRTNASDLCTFLWNGETKEFLGRGKKSWLEITVFYIIFFGVLSAFFISTIVVFHKTIDDVEPKLQGDSSLLGGNPGLGFRPMPDFKTTLIRASNDSKTIEAYVNNINKILQKYKNQTNAVDCSSINETRPLARDHCYFNISALTEHCNEGNGYGLKDGQPCVLLKLNKVFGWTPNPWTKMEIQTDSRVPNSIKDVYSPNQIWVHCHGENAGDVDNLGHATEVKYYPQQGFPVAYYPYLNQENYTSPLVFVQFRNLTKHVGLMVECIALDRNIKVDKKDKEGCIHFELMVDL
ncbi:sodium/potassium-transporting ATPase subunit beta-like isoform X2 [Biomphalaria glabrata]|uniref:Sodium/potassium-transporting ATPase subunit beta-like isoform X2 n=1 Tax=Biomphalaria glabrata TaxID=6526 RepID=A0A9U8E9V3_BIOGL|nr:sodium/potassium-transporting ATPase subunit beta-like isoform X2 [Biomphalaria glabrata]